MVGFRSLFVCCMVLSWAPDTNGQTPTPDPAASAVLFVARRGWHIDIGFNAADLQSPLAALSLDLPGLRYAFFGFGDKHYLLAKHRNVPAMLAAMWPGRGMILVTGLKSSPDEAFGAMQVIALHVTPAQLKAAENFVAQSMQLLVDAPGTLRPYAPGPYEGSLYFIAKDKYSALHTCNTWAAQVLQATGLPVRTHGVVLAGQLWKQARRLERLGLRQLQGGFVPS